MQTTTISDGTITINDLTPDEAGLIQAAVMQLAEQTDNKEHARLLRRIAMQIDKQLTR